MYLAVLLSHGIVHHIAAAVSGISVKVNGKSSAELTGIRVSALYGDVASEIDLNLVVTLTVVIHKPLCDLVDSSLILGENAVRTLERAVHKNGKGISGRISLIRRDSSVYRFNGAVLKHGLGVVRHRGHTALSLSRTRYDHGRRYYHNQREY